MKALHYILDRLSESSTWRGLIFCACALGLQLSPQLQESILTAALSLVGVINILRKGK